MTKKRFLDIAYWIAFGAVVIYFLYAKGWILAEFDSISPQQARTMLASKDSYTLLDVRTPQEYAQEHLDGAVSIPLQVLDHNLEKLPKEEKIIVYCHSGNRSVAASRILVHAGYTPLNMSGGIEGWKAQGFPLSH